MATFDFDWRAACMDAERRFIEIKREHDELLQAARLMIDELRMNYGYEAMTTQMVLREFLDRAANHESTN